MNVCAWYAMLPAMIFVKKLIILTHALGVERLLKGIYLRKLRGMETKDAEKVQSFHIFFNSVRKWSIDQRKG